MLTLCVYFLAFSKFGEILESLHCQSNLILSGFLSFLGVICEAFRSVLENLDKFKLADGPSWSSFLPDGAI